LQTRQAKHAAGADFEFKRGIATDKGRRDFDESRGCDREANKQCQTAREHFVGQHAYVLGVVLKLNNVAGIVRTTQKVGL
jgi:hypothetical protein